MKLPANFSLLRPRLRAVRALWCLTAFLPAAACSSEDNDSNQDIAYEGSSDSSSESAADTDTLADPDTETHTGSTDEGPSGLRLGLGEVIDIPQEQWTQEPVAVAPETGDEQYVVQLTSVSTMLSGKYRFEFEAKQPGSSTTPSPRPFAQAGETDTEHDPMPGRAVSFEFWHMGAQAIAAGVPPASPPPSTDAPQVGDITTFQMSGTSRTGVATIEAEVLRVTDRLVVYGDKTNGIGALKSDVIDEVLQNYESVVLPRVNTYFGEISDVNGDGKITVLFSPLVGDIGAAAYVYTCDLLDPEQSGVMCPYSNGREMIYVATPSSLDSYMGSPKALTEVLSHETQHLVYFHRKYMLGDAIMSLGTLYLNEGLSGLAQDLCGFQAGILFQAAVAIPNVEEFSLTDVLTFEQYDPAGRHNYAIAYLLMRYAFEQMGGDTLTPKGEAVDNGGIAFIDAIESSRFVGIEAVEHATGREASVFFEDFYTAMLLDDRAEDGSNLGGDPRFGFFDMIDDPVTGNTRGVTMNLELAGGMVTSEGVPLETATDGIIRAGGVEYILVEAKGSTIPIELQLSVEDLEAKVQMRLVRIR